MFTVDVPNRKSTSEVVFAFHPPTNEYHARLVARAATREDSILAGGDLPRLIQRVEAVIGPLDVDPALVHATQTWRPRQPVRRSA